MHEPLPTVSKLKPAYIRQVLISRMMYRYDFNNASRPLVGNLLYLARHKSQMLAAKEKRHQRFQRFVDENLHIAPQMLTQGRANEVLEECDVFVCGSDQIWNPGYATTSSLAFLHFASGKKRTIALAPSFGVSKIPDGHKKLFKEWINGIDNLSVREEAGQHIIKELTGRDAELLLDPTMALPVEQWQKLEREPETPLPKKYILGYFLGRVNKEYKQEINRIAKEHNAQVVMLFDIERPEYYVYDPAEVLYALDHADMVMTDSFHGTVFSILFHKSFKTFIRNEGGESMNSRLETLLNRFQLAQDNTLSPEKWVNIEKIIEEEREKTIAYIRKGIES